FVNILHMHFSEVFVSTEVANLCHLSPLSYAIHYSLPAHVFSFDIVILQDLTPCPCDPLSLTRKADVMWRFLFI
ncbi:MAG: hypothetical protein AABY74_04795, partial [Planctomycetota bacterium]